MQKTVTGLRLDARLEEKLARAVELSGWPKADVLRLALSRGLDDLEAINFNIDKAIKDAIAASKAAALPAQTSLQSLEAPKSSPSSHASRAIGASRKRSG